MFPAGVPASATSEQELKKTLLHSERFFSIQVGRQGPTAALAGAEIREISFVAGALIALVHRHAEVLIPTTTTYRPEIRPRRLKRRRPGAFPRCKLFRA